MQTRIQKQTNTSAIENIQPKASHQAPVGEILQVYRNRMSEGLIKYNKPLNQKSNKKNPITSIAFNTIQMERNIPLDPPKGMDQTLYQIFIHGIRPDMDDNTTINTLFQNFISRTDFTYMGHPITGDFHSGDCSTLSHQFESLCRYLGIEGVEVVSNGGFKGFYVPGPIQILGGHGVSSNIAGLHAWFFESHTWVTYNGQIYDVLFMTIGDPPGTIKSSLRCDKTERDGKILYQIGANSFYYKVGDWSNHFTDDASEAYVMSMPKPKTPKESKCFVM